MTSFRRSMSVMQRDGAVQNGEAILDISSPPRLPHSHLALGRLLNSLSNSLDFPGAFLQRANRPIERSKAKAPHLRRSFYHYLVCFMLGIFVSFTPFFSVDVSNNLASKQRTFSFVDDAIVGNDHRKIYSVEKETPVINESPSVGNHSLEMVEKWEVKSDAVDELRETPASYLPSPFQNVELVPRKLLIIVTPTYERPFQAYYLNRLANTLRVVPPPLLWIVVEMSTQSTETAKILRGAGVMYRHLVCNENVTNRRNREVHQRNVALSHIEKHQLDGVAHFADDDRMYSVDLFDQMRQIRGFGTWPVAVLSISKNKVLLEGPVCNGSQVIGWHTNQRKMLYRRFHVDMSGFAFNSTMLWDPKTWHRPNLESVRQLDKAKDGLQETTFIEQLVEDESQMEGFPSGCSMIMVWHLHLQAPEFFYPKGWLMEKSLEVVVPLT